MKSIVLIAVSIILGVAALDTLSNPWLLASDANLTEILFGRDIYNQYVAASNNIGNFTIMDCISSTSSGVPCASLQIFSGTSTGYGGAAAYYSSYLIIADATGKLETYDCTSGLSCVFQVTLETGASSLPTQLVKDSLYPTIIYAAYPNINGQLAVIQVMCGSGGCAITQTLTEFYAAGVTASLPSAALDVDGNMGSSLSIAPSAGMLVIGFPQINNGRGTAWIYDCTATCALESSLLNQEYYAASSPPNYVRPGVLFGKSVASATLRTSPTIYVNLVIGSPGRDATIGSNGGGNYLSNLQVGRAYIYNCTYAASAWSCSYAASTNFQKYYQALTYNTSFSGFCPYADQDFGQSVITRTQNNLVLVGAPSACFGAGVVYGYSCNSTRQNTTLNCGILSYHNAASHNLLSRGDGFGSLVGVSAYFGLANSVYAGLIFTSTSPTSYMANWYETASQSYVLTHHQRRMVTQAYIEEVSYLKRASIWS